MLRRQSPAAELGRSNRDRRHLVSQQHLRVAPRELQHDPDNSKRPRGGHIEVLPILPGVRWARYTTLSYKDGREMRRAISSAVRPIVAVSRARGRSHAAMAK